MKFLIFLLCFVLIFSGSSYAKQNNPYPYKLSLQQELIILGSGSALSLYGLYSEHNSNEITAAEIERLNSDNVNSFDRSATKNWSPKALLLSDIGLYSLMASPLLLSIDERVQNNLSTTAIIYFEGLLLNSGLTLATKNYFERKRPYLYNNELTTQEKLDKGKDSTKSFYSGHTSFSFYSAVFISTVYSDLYPESSYKPLVWFSSLTLASTVGYLRYRGGMHFSSDIIVGAVIGSLIGYFTPVLHRNNNLNITISPILGNSSGISITTFF